MGSSLLTMPWAFEKAGFTQTIIIMILCGIMAYYTGYLCVKLAESCRDGKNGTLPEFQAVCKVYLGKWGEYTALLAANVIVIGALAVYYVLMAKFLFGAGVSIFKVSLFYFCSDFLRFFPFLSELKFHASESELQNLSSNMKNCLS